VKRSVTAGIARPRLAPRQGRRTAPRSIAPAGARWLFLSIPAVTLRFTAGYRLVFLGNTTMRRLSINIEKLCPTFNHTHGFPLEFIQ
ncbi:MAG: hypothetical protein ACKVX9_04520, partial [Blastocatellia bacterium]